MERTIEFTETSAHQLQAIVFNAVGGKKVVESVTIRCNRATLVAALKKAGHGKLIPRGYASGK